MRRIINIAGRGLVAALEDETVVTDEAAELAAAEAAEVVEPVVEVEPVVDSEKTDEVVEPVAAETPAEVPAETTEVIASGEEVLEPIAATDTVEPVADTTVVEPVVDAVVEPVTDVAVEPVVDAVVEPLADTVVDTVVEPVADAAADAPVVDAEPVADESTADKIDEAIAIIEEPVTGVDDVEETELSESAAEGEEAVDEIEETLEIKEALESIADALAISAANGGMDRHSAAVVGISTQYFYDRVGIKARSMPALESFGGTSSRIGATQLAMEDLREWAKKIWAAMVAAFNHLIAWAKDFYAKVKLNWEKVGKRYEEIKKSLAANLGTSKYKPIENAGLAKALIIGGKIPSSIPTAMKELTKLNSEMFDGAGFYINFESTYVDDFAKASDAQTYVSNFKIDSLDFPSNITKLNNPQGEGFEKIEGVDVYRSPELFGSKAWISRKTDLVGKDAIAVLSSVKSGIEDYHGDKTQEVTVTQLPALKVDELEKIMAAMGELLKSVDGMGAAIEKLESFKTKMMAQAKKLESAAADEDSDDKKAAISAMQKAATWFSSQADTPFVSLSKYGIATANAILEYSNLSIKQYYADKKETVKPVAEKAAA